MAFGTSVMIDPVSALAIATSAYKVIRKGIEMGRELEDMGGQLGTWFGAVADVKSAEAQANDPPLFRKLVNKQSVEQQALSALIARKKIQQQERELRELIVHRYGVDAYKDMMRDRTKIKDTRARALENQRRKMRKVISDSLMMATLLGLGASIVAFIIAIYRRIG